MRFGLDLSPIGPWGDPRTLADLAARAERRGWDGVFLEDYVFHPGGEDVHDAWIALAAIALATERIRLGTIVTPLPRRRPARLAAEAMTLDRLSGGRLILAVGSGDPSAPDTTSTGEPQDPRVRAARLDEGLEVVDALWRGEPVTHRGEHYRLDGVTLRTRPLQRPRIPIWVGGQLTRRRPRERALRWDGACLYRIAPPAWEDVTPDDVRALRAEAGAGFDIAVGGREPADDRDADLEYVGALARAGATWWQEWLPPTTPLHDVRAQSIAGRWRSESLRSRRRRRARRPTA